MRVLSLEGIKYSQVVNNSGMKYSEFRKTLKPNFFVVWRDIGLGYALMILTMCIFIFLEIGYLQYTQLYISIILSILFSISIGFWLAFIQLFLHEASHYNIHPNKKTNDILANVFIGNLVGVSIKSYRAIHFKHHAYLGHHSDTENSYFNPLSLIYLCKLMFGLHTFKIFKNRKKYETNHNNHSKWSLLISILFHTALLIFLVVNHLYFSCLVWCIAVGFMYPFFASLRQILEHRDTKYSRKNISFTNREPNHGKVSRIFKPSIFSFFMGGAGFNRHLIHHWDPNISYTSLHQVEFFLLESEQCSHIVKYSKTTYLKAFFELVEL